MALPSLPEPSTPVLNADGTMAYVWYLFFANIASQTIGLTASSSGTGNVSPGQGQADTNILWGTNQALIG